MTAVVDLPMPAAPRRRRVTVRGAGYVTVVLALSCAAASFFLLMGLTPIDPTEQVVFWALVVNGLLTLLMRLVERRALAFERRN